MATDGSASAGGARHGSWHFAAQNGSAQSIMPSPVSSTPLVQSSLTQAPVVILQVASQASVPPSKPRVTQLAAPKAAPSHSSAPSIVPLPHGSHAAVSN